MDSRVLTGVRNIGFTVDDLIMPLAEGQTGHVTQAQDVAP